MKKLFVIGILFFITTPLSAQVVEPATTIMEQQLESITENNEDNETEDDADLQQLQRFLKDPVNLNIAGETEIAALQVLTPLQIQQLISYRQLLGPLISIYELQAIPLWSPELIRKIRPYVTVSMQVNGVNNFKRRFIIGQHSVLVRASQVMERSKGYLLDKNTATNFYPGTPQKILVRYTYVYKQLLQFGILAEKDPGEQFFKGKQKKGFDFYSFHLFARHIGIISALALGDFTVNLGQGLTQWQSLAFKKSADVINIKRQGEILRPYNSAGEINFHRGVGITISKNKWGATIFVSYKKIDANFVPDTLQQANFVSSLQTSGYHRTNSETADKGVQRQLAFGANLSYNRHNWHMGINAISYQFKLPMLKANEPYNQYALAGKRLTNYSADYSYTHKNFHVFGELACNGHFAMAFITGLQIAVSATVDMSLCYRNISRAYQALYASAFTTNAAPSNEKGVYLGITVRPNSLWQIDAYADMYTFPWLKYRVDKASVGSDFLIQAVFKPNKQLEICSRYHISTGVINVNPDAFTLSPVLPQPRQNWRAQVNYRVSPAVTIRSRTEILWFTAREPTAEQGFLVNLDLLYKPLLKSFSGNLRGQYFETDGYNSRLYAYENDVLYSFSIPVFYDKGYRYYVNLNYDVSKKLTVWARWAQTLYMGKSLIGSGLDEIKGSKRTEARVQLLYKF